MAKKSQLSRRTFLTATGGGAVAMGLAACASDEPITAATDVSETDKTVTWSNWPFYIDEDDDGNYPTLSVFQEETGITVNYRVDYDDNNTYYAKVRDQLQLGQDIGADIVTPTEWMAARWGPRFRSGIQRGQHAQQEESCGFFGKTRLGSRSQKEPALAGWFRRTRLQRRPCGRNSHGR
jgi:hypothetical protein